MLTLEQSDVMMAELEVKSFRVLLVSRSELITFSLEHFFADSPITLISVSDKESALRHLEQSRFDAVITDVVHDLNEGLKLRNEVRIRDRKIPILFMTPMHFGTDIKNLDKIVEDPFSFYIPEKADRKFMLAKLNQVIHTVHTEHSLELLKSIVARNFFLASKLQQSMLPPWLYFTRNYEFSSLYSPYTQLSGDLFEWLPLDENRVLFVFGDVSGHGTHSALAMTAIHSFLTQLIILDKERGTEPNRIATDINAFFREHLNNIVYMSTLIAYMDFKNNFLRYQNCGYMELICLDAETGELENVNPEKKGNLPLGMMKDAVYTSDENVEYHFSDSSVFLFCSDGLADLSKDKEGAQYLDMAHFKRLASILARTAQEDEKLVTLPFLCIESLEQQGYVHPQDDLSMVLIRKSMVQEHEHVFSFRAPADKKAVDLICQKASSFVSQHYHDEELSVCTDLLLEEYLVNVIVHGLNEYEKLNEYIGIKICAHETELKLMIWDHGKEWNGLFLQPEKAEKSLDQLNENLSSSGRGIPIMSKIASRITRKRYCGLNETVFIIPRKSKN